MAAVETTATNQVPTVWNFVDNEYNSDDIHVSLSSCDCCILFSFHEDDKRTSINLTLDPDGKIRISLYTESYDYYLGEASDVVDTPQKDYVLIHELAAKIALHFGMTIRAPHSSGDIVISKEA